MKLAILGNSPLALEAAIRFHFHGAALTWFLSDNDSSGFQAFQGYTSALGLKILEESNHRYQGNTWEAWKSSYEKPLMDYLRAHQEVRNEEVVSVAKRYLAPGEVIPGRSRFLDLFRIIYRVDPRDFIDEQKGSNPETYQRLTEEFVNSLASAIEMYQDYDLVLDFRNDLSKASVNVTGRALGENRVTEMVKYAGTALAFAKTLDPSQNLREIALVGSDSLSAEILVSLSHFLEDKRSRLFVVSSEIDPFEAFLSSADEKPREDLMKIFGKMDEEFEKEKDHFMKKLREWQELDDFVQAKIPRPVEPIPRLVFFSGHNVTAIDELIDQRRLFLTLEKPDFREGKKQPENNTLELKTIGVDLLLVGHAKKDLSILEVTHGEIGYFGATPKRPNLKDAWEHDLKALEGIENEIFKLFSPFDSH